MWINAFSVFDLLAAILLAGVSIGFVQSVELIPDGTLALTLQIQKQYRIPTGSTASVQASGI